MLYYFTANYNKSILALRNKNCDYCRNKDKLHNETRSQTILTFETFFGFCLFGFCSNRIPIITMCLVRVFCKYCLTHLFINKRNIKIREYTKYSKCRFWTSLVPAISFFTYCKKSQELAINHVITNGAKTS